MNSVLYGDELYDKGQPSIRWSRLVRYIKSLSCTHTVIELKMMRACELMQGLLVTRSGSVESRHGLSLLEVSSIFNTAL